MGYVIIQRGNRMFNWALWLIEESILCVEVDPEEIYHSTETENGLLLSSKNGRNRGTRNSKKE